MLKKEKYSSLINYTVEKNPLYFRPNSVMRNKKKYFINADKTSSSNHQPPIIFTVPSSKPSHHFNKNIEKEQLYENNLLLKKNINKIKKELSETKFQIVKKNIELQEKEKIITDFLKENDLDNVHKDIIDKAKESVLISLFKDRYNELKNKYDNECKQNKILKTNIKITKIKEYQIENDLLNKELSRLKLLYDQSQKKIRDLQKDLKEIDHFKQKFLEQHLIVSTYIKKNEILNKEINNLKNKNVELMHELEKNNKKREKLKISKDKLKIKKLYFFNTKKIKEDFEYKNKNNINKINELKKELNDIKLAYTRKNVDYTNLKKKCDIYVKKINNSSDNILKPFKYDNISNIENENYPKNIDKIELYKSLYDESKIKISIYENYLKANNINPKNIIINSGYNGLLNNDDNKLLSLYNKNNSSPQIIKKELQNINSKSQEISENNGKNMKEPDKNIIIETKENTNKKDSLKKEINNKINEDDNTNSNNNNDINECANNNKDNELKIIDTKSSEEIDNKFYKLFHIFLKNFESNNITIDIIENKLKTIYESLEGKQELTKDEFLSPFINLFIELMKVTQENDKKIIISFFNEYLNYLNDNTLDFFNNLIKIFQNLNDYSPFENNEDILNSLAYNLQKYQPDLGKIIGQDGADTHIITFDKFQKIVNDLNISLNDELMEFLLYKMKKETPNGNTIFDLNCNFISKILERKLPEEYYKNEIIRKEVNNKLSEFKINMIKENTDLIKVFEEKIKKYNIGEKNVELIEKNIFFQMMEKYGVTVTDEIKDFIYQVFINDEPNNNDGNVQMMDFNKLKDLFSNDFYQV